MGALVQTGNQLDVAIEGSGFFRVSQPDGSFAYTRSGMLKIDADGRITTAEGKTIEGGKKGGWGSFVTAAGNYRVWLLEVNSICNLKHSTSSALDTKNKTLLADEMYSLFIEPTVKGTAPTAKHLQKLNLA